MQDNNEEDDKEQLVSWFGKKMEKNCEKKERCATEMHYK